MCKSSNMQFIALIQLAPKLIPCFLPIFTDLQNEVFSLNLDISAKHEPNSAFHEPKSKLAHCQSKAILIMEITELVSCYAPLKSEPF